MGYSIFEVKKKIIITGASLEMRDGVTKKYYLSLKNLRTGLARMTQDYEGMMVLYPFSQLD